MSSLLDLTSAGPYAAAITSVFPRKYDTQHNNNKYGTFYMCWLLYFLIRLKFSSLVIKHEVEFS